MFPVSEIKHDNPELPRFTYLEKINVIISESSIANDFVIIPSGKDIEESIEDQIKISLDYAVSFVKKYIRKLNKHHKVIINFERRYGHYVGDSLGLILTLKFIEELLNYDNSVVQFRALPGTAYSGRFEIDGKTKSLSEESVIKKTEAVFFSGVAAFALPIENLETTQLKLSELKKKYPGRDLKLIGVEDIEDLIARRNLVAIKKRSIKERSVKFAKKN